MIKRLQHIDRILMSATPNQGPTNQGKFYQLH